MRRAKLGHVVAQESFRWRGIPAELVGVTPDLAVLRPLEPLGPAAAIPVGSSHDLMVGPTIDAIGNPFGLRR